MNIKIPNKQSALKRPLLNDENDQTEQNNSKRIRTDLSEFRQLTNTSFLPAFSSSFSSPSTTICQIFKKNSLQILNEIKQISQREFRVLSIEGPPHKPFFTTSLLLKLNEQEHEFVGTGNSLKISRIIASMRAIVYLIRESEILNPIQKFMYEKCILNELSSLRLNLDQVFDLERETDAPKNKFHYEEQTQLENDSSRSLDESQPLIINTQESDSEQQKHDKETNVSSPLVSLSGKETIRNFAKIESRVNQFLQENNLISLLNYFIAAEFLSYEVAENQANTKTFQCELSVSKSFSENVRNVKYKKESGNYAIGINPHITENQEHFLFRAYGKNKAFAKFNASRLALGFLFNVELNKNDEFEEQQQINPAANNLDFNFREFADHLAKLVKEKCVELNLTADESEFNSNKTLTVYSSIVQTNEYDLNTAKIVCLTTGTKCIGAESMSLCGRTLNDCHAEILSMRLLRKYLNKRLQDFVEKLGQNENLDAELFELSASSMNEKPFKLRRGIKFHLFISSAPCGDGRIFTISEASTESDNADFEKFCTRKNRAQLRCKLEQGVGTLPVSSFCSVQTWDGLVLGERLKIMSCSDKLCKANVIGVQGALLSHFLEPIYFDSIIIGSYYNRSHLARALYGRIVNHIGELPNGFKVHRPILSSITNCAERQVAKSSNKSFIWSNDLSERVEILSCKEGRKEEGSASEICKYVLFDEWLKTLQEINKLKFMSENSSLQILKHKITTSNGLVYSDLKRMAHDYQDAKIELFKQFKNNELGCWITKPFDQDEFMIRL